MKLRWRRRARRDELAAWIAAATFDELREERRRAGERVRTMVDAVDTDLRPFTPRQARRVEAGIDRVAKLDAALRRRTVDAR